MRILVVEDEPANLRALGKLFHSAGHEVTLAQDGLQAYAALERITPDAIVCDVGMPNLGGVGFYEQMEEKYPQMASRTIFVTAFAGEPSIRTFLERTGQPFLGKPFRPAELLELVTRVGRQADI